MLGIRYSPERIQWAVKVMRKARGTKVCVVNVNRNDGRWNRNVNRLGNDNVWNRENRLVLRNSPFSPAQSFLAGVFLSVYVFQPTSILLASTRYSESRAY